MFTYVGRTRVDNKDYWRSQNVKKKETAPSKNPPARLEKVPTGIAGLDEITGGGFPKGRPALVWGSAGCGKTLLAMEFLVRGAMNYNEPGVFIAFESKISGGTK